MPIIGGGGAGLLVREGGLMAFDCSKGGVKSEGALKESLRGSLVHRVRILLLSFQTP